jgi:hypothetical protein
MKSTEDRQHIQDIIYIEAYRAWVESLPPDQRAELAALNLATPDANRNTNKGDDDLALSLASSQEATWGTGTQRDGLTDPEERRDEAHRLQLDGDAKTNRTDAATIAAALAAFCARVRAHPNPLLAFDTLCFATGLMGLEGRTQTALAQLHGVTNAAFSKQVLGWLDIFDLTPPRGCRSLRTRDNLTKARQLLRQKRPIKAAADGKTRRRNRYPDRSADPTVVFVRGLDLFRRWFRKRCRKLPLRRWSPEAREILRVELAWFAKLHSRLTGDMPRRPD